MSDQERPAFERPPVQISIRAVAQPIAATALSLVALYMTLRLAVGGVLPWPATALIAPASLLTAAWSLFRVGVRAGVVAEADGAVHRRHGFWVVAVATCTSLPTLGAFSLVDPWETHYAEVAREMLERRDFISPWWANEGFFMSKPAFTFWLEAASMWALGVRTGPDQVLTGIGHHVAHPEWAVRLPSFAFALIGGYVLYAGVARVCGRRAGLLGAVALFTLPGYAMLSHQAMTDMPLVGCSGASVGLLLIALSSSDHARVRLFAVRAGRVEARLHVGHLVGLALAAIVVPQIVALLAEHVRLGDHGLSLGAARYFAGSPHACGTPGQPVCAPAPYAHPRLAPAMIALTAAPVLGWLVVHAARETRVVRLAALAGWGFAALAVMAKGPAGLFIPAAGALAFIAWSRSLRPLGRLEIARGLVIVTLLVAPWYAAAWARHGKVFIDELVLRHMLGRALDHLHDTNEGDDVGVIYFVRQLGYATFPWCGAVAAAALALPRHDDRSRRSGAKAVLFGVVLAGFTLVSIMRTKFHHYGLITLPPLAMLTGLWLDDRVSAAESPRGARRNAWTAAIAVAAACVVVLVARDLSESGDSPGASTRIMQLVTYRYTRRWVGAEGYATAFAVVGAMGALATVALAARRRRRLAVGALAAISIACAVVILDGYLMQCAPNGGQREVFVAYYRARSRARAPAPLVAYHLNWKGENFYSGNHVAIFISSGAPMGAWIDRRRQLGDRTFFFVTERGAVSALRSELAGARSVEEITDRTVSDEFTLVRADML